MKASSPKRQLAKWSCALLTSALVIFGVSDTFAAETADPSGIKDRTIGYVLSGWNWSMYATKEKTELMLV